MEEMNLLCEFERSYISVSDICELSLNITNTSPNTVTLKNTAKLPAKSMPTLQAAMAAIAGDKSVNMSSGKSSFDNAFCVYLSFIHGKKPGYLCTTENYGEIVVSSPDLLWDAYREEDPEYLFYWKVAPKESVDLESGDCLRLHIANIHVNDLEGNTPLRLFCCGSGYQFNKNVTIHKIKKPEISFETVEKSYIYGDKITLKWKVENGAYGMTMLDTEMVNASGTKQITVGETLTYRISHQNHAGIIAQKTLDLSLDYKITSFGYSLVKGSQDSYIELRWTTKNLVDCTILPNIGSVQPNGSKTLWANGIRSSFMLKGRKAGRDDFVTAEVQVWVGTIPTIVFAEATGSTDKCQVRWTVSDANSIELVEHYHYMGKWGSAEPEPQWQKSRYTSSMRDGSTSLKIEPKYSHIILIARGSQGFAVSKRI